MANKLRKKLIVPIGKVVLSVLFLGIVVVLIIIYWPQNNIHKITKVKIEPGSSLTRITNQLHKEKIISNKKMFDFAVRILGKEKEIPIGTFNLIKAKSNYDIINQLIFGTPEVKKVTILEGWNINQIASQLSNKLGLDSTRVVQLAYDPLFLKSEGVSALSLEGYLYPDTYFFFIGDEPESILSQLVKKHKQFWVRSHLIQAKKLNLSKNEIITLASIIEGEAIHDSERPKISAVYHNRLNIGMKLQADPTIQYIIRDGPRRLLNKDLRIDSPYNTYLNKGLPPGPINSPSNQSLLAALYPENNDFLFFVATGDGYHTFTTNEKDHNKAKRKLQKLRRSLKRNKKK